MSTRQTQKWTAEVHEDILLAFVKVSKMSPAQMSEVMNELTAKGYAFSESALKQHIGKLQKKEGNGSPAPTTAAAGNKPTKRKAASRKAKDDSDPDDVDNGSPIRPKKRATKAKAKTAPKRKAESPASEAEDAIKSEEDMNTDFNDLI